MSGSCIVRSTPVARTPRLLQLEGLFDLPPTERSERRWSIDLPLEERPWHIGLITGPSGSGKTTMARTLFADVVRDSFVWPEGKSLVDGFPAEMSIKEISALLASVGFSSPPSWIRPFATLSNGEQFRATLARGLAEKPELWVMDEFTSVVDRTVARIGSAAVAKGVRRRRQRFVAVTCHADVEDWLDPDWVFRTATGEFSWRSLRGRPPIEILLGPTKRGVWRAFAPHHYLSGTLARGARCYLGEVEGEMAAFTAVLPWPHPRRPGWREHRTVCLPDFQGVGIGHAVSDAVASLYQSTGRPYRSVTSSPAMIAHRAKSPYWRMTRAPARMASRPALASLQSGTALARLTASFTYVGPARTEEARRFGIHSARTKG